MLLDCLDVLMPKVNLKKIKKHYFDAFQAKNILKINLYNTQTGPR
jgi:hypothetical protein